MNYTIVYYNDQNLKEWDDFVSSHPKATIFHTSTWKKVVQDTFNYKPLYLIAKNREGVIVAICPAFKVKTLFGSAIISQPIFEYGEPLVLQGHEQVYSELLKEYKNIALREHVKYIEFRPLMPSDEKVFESNGFKKQFKAYDFFIDVKGKDFEKDIWSGLYTKKSRVRNSVKKALEYGLTVREGVDTGTYYNLYIKTMRKLGSPLLPQELFENIKKYSGGAARFTFAMKNDVAVAGLLSFPFNGRNLMVGLVSDPQIQEMHANDLLYNEQIEFATKSGFNVVDFGRTRPDSSYEQFKKKWGSTKIDLYSYVYPPKESSSINPYKLYLIFSGITKKIPWLLTNKPVSQFIIKRFP